MMAMTVMRMMMRWLGADLESIDLATVFFCLIEQSSYNFTA
jgi:hypothetical protein